jgi:small subunit ribosomal protein S1
VAGIVKNITDYGCFVDLGGIDGLLHITDMSWGRVNHPSEMFEVGDEVEVKVLKFDPDSERVSLGLKQITEDPWAQVMTKYGIGDRVNGKVVSLTDYGAFVELEDGHRGPDPHLRDELDQARQAPLARSSPSATSVEAVILDIDTENKRISLGMKQIEMNPWELLQERYPVGSVVRGKIRNITNFGLFIGIEEGIDGLVHVSTSRGRTRSSTRPTTTRRATRSRPWSSTSTSRRSASASASSSSRPTRGTTSSRATRSARWSRAWSRKVLDFGAIVEIDDAIEGLVHISELSYDKVNLVSDVANEGDKLRAKVISLIPEERKIGLSLKRLIPGPARAPEPRRSGPPAARLAVNTQLKPHV